MSTTDYDLSGCCCGEEGCECGACANATSNDTCVLTITGVTQYSSPPTGEGCCSDCADLNGSWELNKCCEPNAADGSCVWSLTELDESGDCKYVSYSQPECVDNNESTPDHCFPGAHVQILCDEGYFANAVVLTRRDEASPCNFGFGSVWQLSEEFSYEGELVGDCDCHEHFQTERTMEHNPANPSFPKACCDCSGATCTMVFI